MSDKIESLLEKLSEWDRESAEVIEIALAYGESGEPVLAKMLERRLEDAVGTEEECCCGIDTICMPPLEDDPGFDDNYADDYNEDSDPGFDVEPEEPPVDLLSQKLGVDIDSQPPLGLAVAIVQTAGGDSLLEDQLIDELGRRGKNRAQLTSLVEGL